ncbi:hypothetical protein A2714_04210 [Candidatus Woesebacteria bacterium RIFCSPHIGHO2_01_FULL_38_9]|uniref:Uncharacterized protein n=2 Tax=Candidatus Woeseibacteriota TaxID=1752722 RepID=A0A1F7XY16_9BACT|nr:MAG: hypothetical protein A2714_04210 [Candidatus Woesebacteria bacterium RIFCSPHIGHO2_01_FULL_38_9]OGM58980.1 MAG: hypothetical protein A3A75_00515 [Candidatus Woesebacteria bacterium RIFCSPLOWO2_01_FULL_39_10]
MNKNSKGIAHLSILIVLALVVVGGIGYYAYKNGQIKIPSQNSANVTSPTPTGTNVDITNWKIYSDDRFGFEFSYPSKFTYQNNGNLLPPSSRGTVIGFLNNTEEQLNEFMIVAVQTDVSLNEYIESRKICTDSTFTPSCRPTVPGSILNSLQIVTNEGQYSRVFTFVKHSDLLFEFSHQSGKVDEQFLIEYNQILSTIKFTTPKSPILDWSKFSNINTWAHFNTDFKTIPKRNFSFAYPRIFTVENQDSGSVTLHTDYYTYVSMEQIPSINSFPGNSLDQKLHILYQNSNYSPLESNNFTEIINRGNLTAYRIEVEREANCSLVDVFDSPRWNCYVVSLGDKGVAIAELKPVPESVMIELIRTIRFK